MLLGGVVVPSVDEDDDDTAGLGFIGLLDGIERAGDLRRRPKLALIVELDDGKRIALLLLDVHGSVHLARDATAQRERGRD